MKIISLYGYMELNLGDDLMIELLLKRYPNHLFFYYGRDAQSDLFLKHHNFTNLNAFYNKFGRLNHIFNILTFYKKEDFFYNWMLNRIKKRTICSVYIGGSLFKESPNTNMNTLLENESKKLSTGPLFIIGANFGPFLSNEYYNGYHMFFQNCAGVSFRDTYSATLFKNIKHVQYASDVVFNLENIPANNNQNVVISVIDFHNRDNIKDFANSYDKLIVKLCKDVVEHGLTPILQSCCKFEGDEFAIERILNQLDCETRKKTKYYFYNGNTDECLDLFSKSNFIIATRFHSMILAIRYKIPFFCLAYDNKIIKFLNDLNCNAYCLPQDYDKIISENLISKCQKIDNISDIILSANNQFKQLDYYLINTK